MMNDTIKRTISKKLRDLIILCTYNIKGMTEKEKIKLILPIRDEDISIYMEEEKIVIKKNEDIIGEVWNDEEYYSNLEILKKITPLYGITCKGNGIIDIMKYRNMIILLLT